MAVKKGGKEENKYRVSTFQNTDDVYFKIGLKKIIKLPESSTTKIK
jgi:hypothetical protein